MEVILQCPDDPVTSATTLPILSISSNKINGQKLFPCTRASTILPGLALLNTVCVPRRNNTSETPASDIFIQGLPIAFAIETAMDVLPTSGKPYNVIPSLLPPA